MDSSEKRIFYHVLRFHLSRVRLHCSGSALWRCFNVEPFKGRRARRPHWCNLFRPVWSEIRTLVLPGVSLAVRTVVTERLRSWLKCACPNVRSSHAVFHYVDGLTYCPYPSEESSVVKLSFLTHWNGLRFRFVPCQPVTFQQPVPFHFDVAGAFCTF
jgi:hypothetical protein